MQQHATHCARYYVTSVKSILDQGHCFPRSSSSTTRVVAHYRPMSALNERERKRRNLICDYRRTEGGRTRKERKKKRKNKSQFYPFAKNLKLKVSSPKIGGPSLHGRDSRFSGKCNKLNPQRERKRARERERERGDH